MGVEGGNGDGDGTGLGYGSLAMAHTFSPAILPLLNVGLKRLITDIRARGIRALRHSRFLLLKGRETDRRILVRLHGTAESVCYYAIALCGGSGTGTRTLRRLFSSGLRPRLSR